MDRITTCVLLCLVSFTEHNNLKVHPCRGERRNIIPFSGWIILHCWTDPTALTFALGDGHVGPFLFATAVNKAAVNICVQVFVWSPGFSSLGVYVGVEKLHQVIIRRFTLQDPPNCFPEWPSRPVLPPAAPRRSTLSTSWPALTTFPPILGILAGISAWFWVAFPWQLLMLSTFSYTYWPFVCLPQRNIYSSPLPIF